MSSVPVNTFLSPSSVSASVFNSATDLAGAHLKVGERLEVSAVLPESNTVVLRVRNDNATSSNTSAKTSSPVSFATTRSRPVSTSTTRAREMDILDNSNNADFEALSRDDDGERSPTETSSTGSPEDGLSSAFSSVLFRQAVADAVQKEMEKFRTSEAKRLEDKRKEISKPTSQKKANLNDGAGVITLVEQSRVEPAQTTEVPSTTSTTTTTPTTTTADDRVVIPPNLSEKQKLILKTRKSEQASSSWNSEPAKVPAVTFSSDDISNGLDSFFQGVMGLFGGGSSDSTPSVSSIFSALPFSFSGADTLRNAQVAAANYKPSRHLHATFS
ncbi:hypothetical protein RvY_13315 [Ramazzottius varieornatus]|uniref:Uncharacterized protein n=1 Tax=Ramazzottius varieornatus TaxID=947166 RepID=A0A1D1VMF1_RAMVA|nr:hypothetical protein RvY_13315 [Ramazzottius varieornatus]